MLPGGEHFWKSTMHKAGAFSPLLDELCRVCLSRWTRLSWVRVPVVPRWAWENIPNILGVAWGHLEWWEDAALALCSLPDLAMD